MGQTPPSPTPYPIQTLCLPLPCARQALPALPHPRQTLYWSLRLSPAFLCSIFLTSLTAASSDTATITPQLTSNPQSIFKSRP